MLVRNRELISLHQLEEWERSKGDTTCPTSQNPSLWHPSWLNQVCTTRKVSELKWLVKDNLETNSITIKPEIGSHVTELFSWIPWPYCSLPGCSFPIISLALSANVSPWTIHFRMLDKSPVSGPGRGPPSCNRTLNFQQLLRSAQTSFKKLQELSLYKWPWNLCQWEWRK